MLHFTGVIYLAVGTVLFLLFRGSFAKICDEIEANRAPSYLRRYLTSGLLVFGLLFAGAAVYAFYKALFEK